MYLFFDTETTGLPANWKAPVTDVDNWPRVTQLAWQVYDEDGKLIRERCELIKPDGWVIPDEEFFIENNMSNSLENIIKYYFCLTNFKCLFISQFCIEIILFPSRIIPFEKTSFNSDLCILTILISSLSTPPPSEICLDTSA